MNTLLFVVIYLAIGVITSIGVSVLAYRSKMCWDESDAMLVVAIWPVVVLGAPIILFGHGIIAVSKWIAEKLPRRNKPDDGA